MKKILLLSVLMVMTISACALEIPAFTPDRSVVYKAIDGVELKLHIFNPPGQTPDQRRPAIVFFFGGGWKGGSPSQFYPHCKHLAQRGVVAMAADYRVASRNNTTPAECVKDGKSALRWIRQHAAELGIDPDRLAAGGGSAGGHVAAATAALSGFNEQSDDLSVSCMPAALVLFNPVFDNGPDGYGYDRVEAYWKEFSPLHNLHKGMPPTVVFFGTNDKHVPVKTAVEYQKRMIELGVPCDLHLYGGATHGFFNYSHQDAYYPATVAVMDQFLAALGVLQPASSK
jgi:acetyl esterase/lipase